MPFKRLSNGSALTFAIEVLLKKTSTSLQEQILALLQRTPSRVFRTKDIEKNLSIDKSEYANLRQTLQRMAAEDLINRQKANRFSAVARAAEKSGVLRVNSQGYGFVISEDGTEVFVSRKNMSTALHQDHVRVRLFAVSEGDHPEGQIVEILERARSQIVGTFRFGRRYAYVIPDNLKIQVDIVISAGKEKNAQEGQKVVAVIDEWEHAHLNPIGHITEVLGFADEAGVDVLSIARAFELDAAFPPAVRREAAAIAERSWVAEIEKRRDLREFLIFTIDPADAKDFDDAVSLEQIDSDRYRLGVHIADVSFFVPAESAIDREAQNRGTSVYLVDGVIPMLPSELSTDMCSLRQDEDRLCYSVLIELDAEAVVHSYEVAETVIRSKRRLTYEQAQGIIDGQTNDPLQTTLQEMHHLSQKLIANRKKRGAIDFDSLEVQIDLDEQGVPISLGPRQRLDSHRLIEEFMLLANECVARLGGQILPEQQQRTLPFVYRVHEKPDQDSVRALLELTAAFGVTAEMPSKLTPRFFQNLSQKFTGHAAETILQDAMIRTMMKAKYTVQPLGHFGLAYRYYSHFTSPIRRYPDLLLHRLLKSYQNNGEAPAIDSIEKKCQQASENEVRALEAERASVKLKQVEFIEQHVGDTFAGIISRIVNFGIFVQIPQFMIDGLIHVSELKDDYYLFEEKNYSLVGQNTGRRYRLGDRLMVQIVRVSRHERLIDFIPVDGDVEFKRKKKGKSR